MNKMKERVILVQGESGTYKTVASYLLANILTKENSQNIVHVDSWLQSSVDFYQSVCAGCKLNQKYDTIFFIHSYKPVEIQSELDKLLKIRKDLNNEFCIILEGNYCDDEYLSKITEEYKEKLYNSNIILIFVNHLKRNVSLYHPELTNTYYTNDVINYNNLNNKKVFDIVIETTMNDKVFKCKCNNDKIDSDYLNEKINDFIKSQNN